MPYDYLLYDNRTQGRRGRDWALKVGTGGLKENRRIVRRFVEYCRRSFDARTQPRGFDAALGGIPLEADGYLLCVTLEKKDLSGRRACSFVGIHCTGRVALQSLLRSANPIAMARSVYKAESPPRELHTQGRGLVGPNGQAKEPIFAAESSGSKIADFEKKASPKVAATILWNACSRKDPLPSILGIAVWRSTKTLAALPDQIVFYQDLPPEVITRLTANRQDRVPKEDAARAGRLRILFLRSGLYVIALLGLLICIVAVPLIDSPKPPLISPPPPPPRPPPPPPPPPPPAKIPTEFLERVEGHVSRLSEFEPQGLLSAPVYRLLIRVKVLPEYEQDRSAMISLLEKELPKFQSAVLEKVNLDYYFTISSKRKFDEPTRADKVRERLIELALPVENCRLLRNSFAFQMNASESVPTAWCLVVEAFSKERGG